MIDKTESLISKVSAPINLNEENSLPKTKINNTPLIDKPVTKPLIKPAHGDYEEPIDIIYRELDIQRYSQEPALELLSVVKEMHDCGYIKSYKRYDFIDMKSQLSLTQQDIYQKYQNNCIEVKEAYPTIIEYNQSRSQKQDFLWVMMNSPYRELVLKAKNYKKIDSSAQEQFVFDLVRAVINSQNAQMLLFLSSMASDEIEFITALKLPQVLSSINIEYIQMIVGQAAVLMSCDFNKGISCAASSYFMTKVCFQNENACGMQVQNWFKYNHSFSHNQDIHKVIEYFISLSEI